MRPHFAGSCLLGLPEQPAPALFSGLFCALPGYFPLLRAPVACPWTFRHSFAHRVASSLLAPDLQARFCGLSWCALLLRPGPLCTLYLCVLVFTGPLVSCAFAVRFLPPDPQPIELDGRHYNPGIPCSRAQTQPAMTLGDTCFSTRRPLVFAVRGARRGGMPCTLRRLPRISLPIQTGEAPRIRELPARGLMIAKWPTGEAWGV